jgi:hypothetical protein
MTGKHFDYAMLYRPPGHATVPTGAAAYLPASAEHPFGGVRYDRPLSRDDIARYELLPLDPDDPANLKREFESFRERFLDRMSDGDETYRIGDEAIVTRCLDGSAEWRVTSFADGEPRGHDEFDDFDALARAVWAIERKRHADVTFDPKP